MFRSYSYLRLPTFFVNKDVMKVSPNAYKLLLFIARKTLGFNKQADKIAYSQIKKFTGLSNDTIKKSIEELKASRLITKEEVRGRRKEITILGINPDFYQQPKKVSLQSDWLQFPCSIIDRGILATLKGGEVKVFLAVFSLSFGYAKGGMPNFERMTGFNVTIKDIAEQTCLTERQVRNCLLNLVAINYLCKAKIQYDYYNEITKTEYRWNYDYLIDLLNCKEEIRPRELLHVFTKGNIVELADLETGELKYYRYKEPELYNNNILEIRLNSTLYFEDVSAEIEAKSLIMTPSRKKLELEAEKVGVRGGNNWNKKRKKLELGAEKVGNTIDIPLTEIRLTDILLNRNELTGLRVNAKACDDTAIIFQEKKEKALINDNKEITYTLEVPKHKFVEELEKYGITDPEFQKTVMLYCKNRGAEYPTAEDLRLLFDETNRYLDLEHILKAMMLWKCDELTHSEYDYLINESEKSWLAQKYDLSNSVIGTRWRDYQIDYELKREEQSNLTVVS